MIKSILGRLLFLFLSPIEIRFIIPFSPLVKVVEQGRCVSLKLMGACIGDQSYIRSGLFLTCAKYLRIGNSSKIGINSQLFLYDGLTIGDNVEIGSNLVVHTAEHQIDEPNKLLCKQGSIKKPVHIKNDVYMGSNVTILPGVTIGERVVVGAGSVVTKDLLPNAVYAGVPAKKIKSLDSLAN